MEQKRDTKKKDYFKCVDNTFSREQLSDPYRKIEIEVGDIKQSEFFPQFKTKHWNNEVNFSVRLKSNSSAKEIHSEKDGVIEWKKGSCKTRFYTQNNIDEGGAFEFEVELSKKPKSNVVEFTTKSKGLDFYYQPHELDKNEEKLLQSPKRPEKVKGSYAVYHKEKTGDYSKVGGKNYLAGKAFHIYRPFVIDSKGKKVWCELHIDEKKELLTITIPQDFLDRAIYPIIIDPTFGYTTVGSSGGYSNNDYLFGSIFSNPVDGTGLSISYNYTVSLGTNPSQTSYAALYDTNKKLVGYTYEDVQTTNGGFTISSNFKSNTSLSAQSYFICYTSETYGLSWLSYDVGATNQGPYYSETYGQPPPSDLSSYTTYYTDWKHTIYVTYSTDLSVNVNDSIAETDLVPDIIRGATRDVSLFDFSILEKDTLIPQYDTTYGTSYTKGPNNDKLLTLSYGGWTDNYYSFIYFDTTGYPSNLSSVKLRLYNNGATPNDAQNKIYRILEDWNAPDISSINNPTYDSTSFGSLPTSKTVGWQEVDITALYNGWRDGTYPNYGLTIRSSSNNNTNGNFSSMEGANPPQLALEPYQTSTVDAIRDDTRDAQTNDSIVSNSFVPDIIRGATRDVSSSDVVTSTENLKFSPIRISVSSSVTFSEKLQVTQPISYSLFDVYDVSQTPVNNWSYDDGSSGRSIVRDSVGNLYVVYASYNQTISNYTIRLSRSTDRGATWSQKEVLQNTSNRITNCRIAIDSNDIITISITGYGVINTTIENIKILQGTWNGGFVLSTITDLTNPQFNAVLAVDSNNNIHLTWEGIDTSISNSTIKQIRYVKISSSGVVGTIQTLTNEPSTYGQHFPTVAIDSNNVIHITWYGVYSGRNSRFQIVHLTNINGVWNTAEIVSPNSLNADIIGPSIALDSLNNPRIVCFDNTNYNILYFEYTTSWQPPMIIKSYNHTQYGINFISIALDTQDTEHIVFNGDDTLAPIVTATVISYVRRIKGGIWKNHTIINNYSFNNPIYQKNQQYPNLLYSTFPIIKGVPTNKTGIGAIGIWTDSQSTSSNSANNILGFKTQNYTDVVTISISVSDSVLITENLSRVDTLSVNTFNPVVLTENIIPLVPFYNGTTTDSITLTENIVSAVSFNNISTFDSTVLTERVDAIRDNSRNLSVDENISITSYVANERTDRGIQVFLDNIKITHIIERSSLTVENIMTSQADVCNFTTRKFGAINFVPKVGNEISIFNNGVKIFGGIAVKVTQRADNYKIILYDVECEDYTRFLDKKLVADIFTNQTIEYIIDYMTKKYLSGFTTNHVTGGKRVIAYVAFNYVTVSDCMKQLAKLTDYDWYVDYNKDIHFFSKTDKTAPFEVIDTDGSYIFESMRIRRDTTQLRNKVYVRGGQYLADTFTSQFVSNGIQNIYPLGYKYNDIQVSVTGTVWDGGIDGIDAITPYDYLWNPKQKFIRFRGDRVPNDLSNIRISGQPYLPVRVVLQDEASIASMVSSEGGGDGVYEYLIIDKSINSRAGARERAAAELVSYKNTLSEGQFTTYNDGLQSGQRIYIQSTAYGIDEYFIINKVTARMWTEKALVYDVSLVTTKTMGVIEFLQGLVMKQTTQIVINKDEVVDLVYAKNETTTLVESSVVSTSHNPVSESSTLVETVTEQALNYPVTFVAGPYTPTTTKRIFVLNGSPLA